jgi:hypothetical protein
MLDDKVKHRRRKALVRSAFRLRVPPRPEVVKAVGQVPLPDPAPSVIDPIQPPLPLPRPMPYPAVVPQI